MDYDIDYNVTANMSFLDKQKFINDISLQEDFILNEVRTKQEQYNYKNLYWDIFFKMPYDMYYFTTLKN
jgi:hypothetical protein